MNESVGDILARGPEHIGAWLNDLQREGLNNVADFNWLGLAQASALQATEGDRATRLRWAAVAVRVYELLATTLDVQGADAYEASAMNLRASLIAGQGSVTDDPLLDANTIQAWFFHHLDMTPDEARAILDAENTSVENVRRLRRIKNRLNVIALLRQHDVPLDSTLDPWLALHHRL